MATSHWECLQVDCAVGRTPLGYTLPEKRWSCRISEGMSVGNKGQHLRSDAGIWLHLTLPTAPSPVTTHCISRISIYGFADVECGPTLSDCVTAGEAMLLKQWDLRAVRSMSSAQWSGRWLLRRRRGDPVLQSTTTLELDRRRLCGMTKRSGLRELAVQCWLRICNEEAKMLLTEEGASGYGACRYLRGTIHCDRVVQGLAERLEGS